MYNEYFGLSESPFENNLDQRFLFMSDDHKEVLAALLYFIKERKGLAMVCGDVGTGKTMLISCFLSRLPDTVHPIVISNPLINYRELLHYIARAIGVWTETENILELIDSIKASLLDAANRGETFFLIVDEAHLLSADSLEHVRLLSNIETPTKKLLQILLVGQYELSHKLNRTELRQLRQRININRFLSSMDAPETIQYIDHRLKIVGSSLHSCFESNCDKLIYSLTDGVPRRINQLCDSALLVCMTDGCRKTNRKILRKAHEALVTDVMLTPTSFGEKLGLARWFGKSKTVLVTALVFFCLVSIFYFMTPLEKAAKDLFIRQVGAVTQSAEPNSQLIKSVKNEEMQGTGPVIPTADQSIPGTESAVSSPSNTVRQDLKYTQAVPAKTNELAGIENSGLAEETESKQDRNQVAPREPDGAAMGEPVGGSTSSDDSFAATIRPPAQIRVKKNDTLMAIALLYYPSTELGLEGILLANPESAVDDHILPGQMLNLPAVNPSSRIIQLRENLFYAVYGRYNSMQAAQKAILLLSRKRVRYLVLSTGDTKGGLRYRVILGGYERSKDLEKMLDQLKVAMKAGQ